MELFVINRHGEEKQEVTEEQEKEKLDQVLRRIERKKQHRIRQREREREKKRGWKAEKSYETEDLLINKKALPKIVEDEEIVENGVEEEKTETVERKTLNTKNFTILGADTNFKKSKTDRILPQWLANPTKISSNLQELTATVSKMKLLDKSIRQQLKKNGIKYFFPVQAEVIPFLLKVYKHKDTMTPRDICVSAPTGSGKTLAFVLPIVQALKHHTVTKIRALVILPTQDLAEQVFKCFKTYTQDTNIEAGLITGKHSFNLEQNQLGYLSDAFGYVSKVDILICTAGRLVSHLKMTKGFSLQFLEFLIIDEADRVLESVQDDWLYHLEKHISEDNFTLQNRKILNLCTLRKQRSPQKLLFSATLTQDPEKIEKLSLFQPKLFSSVFENGQIESGTSGRKYTTPRELTEKYCLCTKELKPLVLYNFIKKEKLTKTIVFTHSVETTHRLKILLQSLFKSKLKIDEISSSLKGANRDTLISNFTKGDVDILICTDFLARGIDLPGVHCVISYSAPKYLKTYIHRAGRTARAGESGLTVTLLHNEQLPAFKNLLNQMKKEIDEITIDEEKLESLSEKYQKALNKLKEAVAKEEKDGMNSILSKKKAIKKLKTKVKQESAETSSVKE